MLDLFNRVYCTVWTRLRREEGQTMVEYGLIVALVAIAAITILGTMSDSLNGVFTKISDALTNA